MVLKKFYESWKYLRFAALLAAALICLLWAIQGDCHTLEMDYNGPGSHIDQFSREYNDNQNRESAERVNENDRNGNDSGQRDRDRANEYERDHGV